MNAPIKLAQATTPGAAEIRTVRLEKPADGKAVLIQLSTNQTIKVDFSGIAKEKIIIVRVGERAVILFENGATITLDPFWDSLHRPLANLQIEVAPGQIISPAEFALLFPTTIDQSVLPAAGEGNDPQDAGANFSDPTIDPIFTPPPLDLLPPTELNPVEFLREVGPFVDEDFAPTQSDEIVGGIVEEEHLQEGQPASPAQISDGNEDEGVPGDGDPGDVDTDTPADHNLITITFTGNDANDQNLEDLINSGNPPFDFTFNDVSGQPVLYTGGGQAFSKGEQIFYFKVDDKTIIGFASEDGDGTFDGASNPGTTTLGDGSYGNGSNDDRIVFMVTLDTGGEDGAWTIEIYDQFDHPLTDNPGTGATEIAFEDLLALNLTSTLHAEDADSDPLDFTGDAWTVGVIDDTPIVLDSAQECITVDEDDIKNFQSIGTSPNDGDGDGSETGNPPSNVFGPAFASGSLAGLVKVGADEIGSDDSGNGTGKFSLIELNNDTLTELGLIGLRSQGDLISYLVVAGDGVPGPSEVLEARASDGRLVFTLEVFEDGDYEFSLHDQMDHDPPYDIDPPGFDSNDNPFFPGNTLIPPADQNTDLVDFDDDNTPPGEPRNFDIDELNLGALIQFEDYDHDAVTLDGEFVVKIRDDIPEIKHGKDICLTVDEDDIDTGAPTGSDGNHPNDGNADGSWTGSPFNPSDPGPATVFGALGGLFGIVQPGADEPLTFSFIVQGGIGEHIVTELAELAGLSSKGEDLSYDIQGNVLYGYVNGGAGTDGYEGTDRLVFKFTLQPNGLFAFELHDQIDHDPPNDDWSLGPIPSELTDGIPLGSGSDENFDLQDDIPFFDVTALPIGFLIQATDYDGDSVIIGDHLTIKIRDDVPETTSATTSIRVEEDELSELAAAPTFDLTTGITDGDGFTDEATFTEADLAALVNVGADEPVNFDLKTFLPFTPGGNVKTTGGDNITSEGVTVKYANGPGGSIIGFADTNGNGFKGATEREVFRITDNGDGSYTFDLKDKIDHNPPGGNNDDETLTIDLTSLFTAEDFDHDKVTLLEDSISVVIENDVPLIGDCSIIVNGSFETGHNLLGSDWEIFASLPPPGWVQGANGIPFEVQGSGAAGPGVNAQHGNFFVELDSDTEGNPTNPLPDINPTSNTNATIQQTVATDPGQTYELHFWYMPRPADGDANSSSMEVLWEGAVVHSIDSSTAPAGWQEITLYLTAADASSILGFRGTGQQNELGAFIDNVRLCAIGVVDEDGLIPPDLSTGIGDSQPGDVPGNATVANGSLLIQWGADDFDQADGLSQDSLGTDRSVTFTNNTVDVGGIVGPLTSQGDVVNFILQDAGTKLIGQATDGRLVFEVKLFDDGSGSFRFELFDQLDHANGNNENDITLEFNFTAKDSDGDTANGDFKILVDDDVPVLIGKDCLEPGTPCTGADPNDLLFEIPASASLTVDISDILSSADFNNSIGFYFADAAGNPISGRILEDNANSASDKLLQISAADIPDGAKLLGFFLVPDGNDDGLNDGDAITFENIGGEWFAFKDGILVDTPEADRILFSDSRHNPDLQHASDPDSADGDDFETGTGARDSNWEDKHQGSDADFNDVQFDVQVCATPVVLAVIDEDDINNYNPNWATANSGIEGSTGTSPNDGDGDGSVTGDPEANTTGPAVTTGTLAGLVALPGADEPLKYEFVADAAVRTYLTSLGLESKGALLSYDLNTDGVIIGFVDIGGAGAMSWQPANDDRLVFKLTLNPDGSFKFELHDQLDHDAPFDDASDVEGPGDNEPYADQNYDLQDSDPNSDVTFIDFGKITQASDFDNDPVSLEGRFLIQIRDDIPIALDDKDFVQEGKTDGVKNTTTGNVITGIDPDADPENILLQADEIGADEPPSLCTVKHDGETYTLDDADDNGLLTIETELGGKLEIQMTGPNAGQYTYTAPCSTDHPPAVSLFTVSVGNVPAGVTITAFDPTAPNPSNPGDVLPVVGKGFGVASPGPGGGDDDGIGEPRFDEINHTSGGTSETLIFKLDGDAVATKANVDLSFFFGPAEAGVGSERGHWEAFLNGVSVGSSDFTATSPSGDSSTVVSVGGCAFDEIRFTALIGTADASGQGDSSDYYVKQIEFINEPPVSESFEYALKDYDGDKDHATLTIKIGDGVPSIQVDPSRSSFLLDLDETHAAPVGVDTYNAAIGETESLGGPPNGEIDDVGAGPTDPPNTNGVFGSLSTDTPNELFSLFSVTVDPGPDIPPVIDYDFQLLLKDALGLNLAPGVGVQTILSVTDPEGAFADDSIYLFKELDGSITGRVGNGAGNPIAFTVSISDPVDNPEDPSDATLKVDQILAIDHHQYLLDQGFAFNAANGNYYKLVDGDFDWTTASAQAGALGGFLATVTSAQENAFIAGLFDDNAATSPDGAWLGGGDTAVEGVYRWLTGPEAGQLFTYTNWELNALPFPQQEPNDAQFPGDDDFVTIGRFDTSFSGDAGTWNDDGDPSHGGAHGYVVEISGNQFDQQAFLDIFGGSDLAGIAVQLTVTVTDDDGDSDSDSAERNVTNMISFDDDGPVIVGDPDCIDLVEEPGLIANFVFILDTSGSVEEQFALLKDAAQDLLDALGNSGAQDLRVHIVEFDTGASVVGTYDLIVGGSEDGAALADALADVEALLNGGNTNYEAGFQQALLWMQGGGVIIPVNNLISSFDSNSGGDDDTARIIGNGSTHIALLSGWNSPGTASGELLDVSGSISGGWGVNDNNVDNIPPSQLLRFDFGSFNDFDNAGTYNNAGGFNGTPVQSATFTLDDNTSGEVTNFFWTIHFVGGGSEAGTQAVDGNSDVTLFGTGGNAGKFIAYIEFSVELGDSGDVDLQSVSYQVLPGTIPDADINEVIFLSDGEPNRANDNYGNVFEVGAQNAIDEITGVDDPTNEVGQTEADGDLLGQDQEFNINAYGVNLSNVVEIDDEDDFDANSGGDNDTAYVVEANGVDIAVVSAWEPNGTTLDDADVTSEGFGVNEDDEIDETDEMLRFDFGAPQAFGGGYSVGAFSGAAITSATFVMHDFGAGANSVNYRVFYTDATSSAVTNFPFAGDDSGNLVITPPVGKTIAYVEFTVPASEGGRVELVSVTLPTFPGLAILDQVEGPGGDAENITAPGDLETSLAAIIAGLGGGGGGGGGGLGDPVPFDLSSLLDFGTDGPNTGGGFALKTFAPQLLGGGILSDSLPVWIDSNGTILTGFINDGAGGANGTRDIDDTVVFTLTQDPDGTGSFVINQGLEDAVEDGEVHLDFGHFVTATDGDYDTVTLSPSDLCFIVPEDTDTPFEEPGSFLGIVEEEHLANLNPTFPVGGTDNIEGSNGNEDSTSFNPNGDDNPATPDGDDDTLVNFNVTTDVTSGTLTITGGDGALTFGFEVTDGTPVVFGENNAIQVLSKGDPVYFVRDLVDPNILYGVANDDGGPDDLQTDDRIVFKIELTPATGAFVFTLIDQIDHHPYDFPAGGAVEFPVDNQEGIMTIDLAGVFNVDDADANVADKHVFQDVKVKVIDDIPVVSVSGTSATVDEDDLDNFVDATDFGSTGTDSDEAGDGPAVTTSGNLNNLVAEGADESPTFHFSENAIAALNGFGFSSKGDPIVWDIVPSGDSLTLMGYVENGVGDPGFDNPADRPVLSMEINSVTGAWTFTLLDQVDHIDGNGENTLLKSTAFPGGVTALDFGVRIYAQDSDGDRTPVLDNLLSITIVDDIPEKKGIGEGNEFSLNVVIVAPNEDDLDNFVPGTGFGSEGSSPDLAPDDGDLSITNPDGSVSPVHTETLFALVKSGADEPLTFSFQDDAISTMANLGLTSKDGSLSYELSSVALGGGVFEHTLTAFVELGVANPGYDAPTDRPVFTFTFNSSTGAFDFKLIDQLDHLPGNGEDITLNSTNPAFPDGIVHIDLGALLQAVDFDNDPVDLDTQLTVRVIDDVPAAADDEPALVAVFEDALGQSAASEGTYADGSIGILDNDGNGTPDVAATGDQDTFTVADLAALVGIGADEPVKFALTNFTEDTGIPGSLKSKGAFVNFHSASATSLIGFADETGGTAGVYDAGIDRVVFTLTDNLDGTFTFDLDDQIDHTPSVDVLSNDLLTLDIDLTPAFTVTDFDDDPVILGPGSIVARVENDVPAKVNTFVSLGTVFEDALNSGLEVTDLSIGNLDNDGDGDVDGADVVVNTDQISITGASLNVLVTDGADEDATVVLTGIGGTATGPVLTSTGDPVFSRGHELKWLLSGASEIIAYADEFDNDEFDGTDRIVFRITDAGGGNFLFDLEDQLDHPAGSGDSGVTANLTLDLSPAFAAKDFDGDRVPLQSGSVRLLVENDVPLLTPGTVPLAVVTHDESGGLQDTGVVVDPDIEDFNDNDVQGDGPGVEVPDAIFAIFEALTPTINDPHVSHDPQSTNFAIGYASSGVNLLPVTVNIGADELQPPALPQVVYSLEVANSASGLFTTEGRAIVLFEEGSALITGRYDNAGGSVEDTDPIAFAIHVDPATGVVYLAQWTSLDHGTEAPGQGQPSYDEALTFAAGRVTLRAEVTDFDGDIDSLSTDLANRVFFEDDGPSLSNVIDADILDDEQQDTAVNPGVDALGIQGGPGDDGVLAFTTGTLAFTSGADGVKKFEITSVLVGGGALQAILVNPTTGQGTAENVNVLWTQNPGDAGGTYTGTGVSGQSVFTLVVEADGDYTFTLFAPLVHSIEDDPATTPEVETEYEDNISLVFGVKITDGDNDTATATLTIAVDDDTPDAAPEAIEISSVPADPSVVGLLNFEPGADGWSGASLAGNTPPPGLESNGNPVQYYVSANGMTLIGYIGPFVANGGPAPLLANQVFVLTVDPSIDTAPANDGIGGNYTFDLLQPIDAPAIQVQTIGGASFGAGPEDYQILSTGAGGSGAQLTVASGWTTTGAFNAATWLATGVSTGVVHADINGSTGGWGVNNNNFTTGEFMRFDFSSQPLENFDGAGGYVPPAVTLPDANQASFTFPFFMATDDISYVAFFSDGSRAAATLANPTLGLVVNAPAGQTINHIEFYANSANGSGKVDLGSVAAEVEGGDVNLSFNLALLDGDNDAENVALAVTVAAPTPLAGIFSLESGGPTGLNNFEPAGNPNEDADIFLINPGSPTPPFANVSMFLEEDTIFTGDNNIDALHVLSDGRILFSTESGVTQGPNIGPNGPSGQTDIFLYNPATDTVSLASSAEFAVNFPASPPSTFASARSIDALHVVENASGVDSIIFSSNNTFTLPGDVAFDNNDLVHWDGSDADRIFDASDNANNDSDADGVRGLTGARLYNPAVAWNPAAPTQFGTLTITNMNDADLDDVHILATNGSGIPTHFIVGFDADLNLSGNNSLINFASNDQTKFNNTQLLEVRIDNAGNYWVNARPYFDSGQPGNDGDDLDAFAMVEAPPPPTATADHVFTNVLDGSNILIPIASLLFNDGNAGALPIVLGTASGDISGISIVGNNVVVDPNGTFTGGSFTYQVNGGIGGLSPAVTVTIDAVDSQQIDASGSIVIGDDAAIFFSILGDGEDFGVSGSTEDEEEVFEFNGTTITEFFNGDSLSNSGEDIDALHVSPSGRFEFSIVGDDEEFGNVSSNAGDAEDIFERTTAGVFNELLFDGGDGSDNWGGDTNVDAYHRLPNGDILISFSEDETIASTTYQDEDIIYWDVSEGTGSIFFDGTANGVTGDIDDVSLLANGDIVFSLDLGTTLSSISFDDSDLIRWDGSSYSMFFDGSTQSLAADGEDIDAASVRGSDIINGSSSNDFLVGGSSALRSTPATFTILADGTFASNNNDFLQFDFTGGAPDDFVKQIIINLRAGSDADAAFDPLMSGGTDDPSDWGPNFILSGVSAPSTTPSAGGSASGTLNLNFTANNFGVGDSFDLNMGVINIGNENDGSEFDDVGATATVVFQDGRSQTVAFADVDFDTSRAQFTVQRPVVDDVINGGAGNDVLWGQGGNDILTGGANDDSYLYQPGEGGIDEITAFEAGDSFLVDVVSLSFSPLDAVAIAAGDFASGTDTTAGFNGTGKEFFFETDNKTLWYSDNGTVANQIALATISSGVDPNATNINIF